MSDKERPAKTYFKKMYENEFYEVHFKELKGTLVASSSDLWDLMEGFADQEKKLYLEKLLEEAEKEIEIKYPEQTDEENDRYFDYEASIRKEGTKWLLNHLKQKQ